MIFEIISGGEKTDWVGKEWAGLFFPRGKEWEKTDWGEIPASDECKYPKSVLINTHMLSHNTGTVKVS